MNTKSEKITTSSKTENAQKTFEIDLNSRDNREINFRQLKRLSNFMKRENIRVLEINDVRLEKYDSAIPAVSAQRPAPSETKTKESLYDIKSPLIGIFYAAPAPDAPPYVRIGQRVKKGDVLCVIEAMKLMNEIVADSDCEVVETFLKNGDIVEFDQVMFRVR